MRTKRVLLLGADDGGLIRRAQLRLQRHNHAVDIAVAPDTATAEVMCASSDADLIVAIDVAYAVPSSTQPILILHLGPVGNYGPTPLAWPIRDDDPMWGVSVRSPANRMDAGAIWAHRSFALPEASNHETYHGVAADSAMDCLLEAVANATDPTFRPTPADEVPAPIAHASRHRAITTADYGFDWAADDTDTILRRIHAADHNPGVRATLRDRNGAPLEGFSLFDAHRGRHYAPTDAVAGTVIGRRGHNIEVATSNGSVWIGHLGTPPGLVVPAVDALAGAWSTVPPSSRSAGHANNFDDITYRRNGAIATITVNAYRGQLGSQTCQRLAALLRWADNQPTRVLVVRGLGNTWPNRPHRDAIASSSDPGSAAVRNALDWSQVCRALLLCRQQVTVAAISGDVTGSGIALAAAADAVLSAERVTWIPGYRGSAGTDLHSYSLPRRCGHAATARLLHEATPMDAHTALDVGLVELVGPNHGFTDWTNNLLPYLASPVWNGHALAAKHTRLLQDFAHTTLTQFELAELSRMKSVMADWGETPASPGLADARAAKAVTE